LRAISARQPIRNSFSITFSVHVFVGRRSAMNSRTWPELSRVNHLSYRLRTIAVNRNSSSKPKFNSSHSGVSGLVSQMAQSAAPKLVAELCYMESKWRDHGQQRFVDYRQWGSKTPNESWSAILWNCERESSIFKRRYTRPSPRCCQGLLTFPQELLSWP
jgi:hypothetical protein